MASGQGELRKVRDPSVCGTAVPAARECLPVRGAEMEHLLVKIP